MDKEEDTLDIYLSWNNREDVILLPIPPVDFKIVTKQNNETFNSINQGEIRLIGLSGLATTTISSYFPSKEYPFSRNNTIFGMEYVEMINKWKASRRPIRLVVPDKNINMAFAIDNFEYGTEDVTGDIYYTLSLTEFRFIEVG